MNHYDSSVLNWENKRLHYLRISNGLSFIAKSEPFFCCWSPGSYYDDETAHKSNMAQVSKMANSLLGYGWKKLRIALLVLAGLMLVASAACLSVSTMGIGLALGCSFGAAAVLTGGVGFFVGCPQSAKPHWQLIVLYYQNMYYSCPKEYHSVSQRNARNRAYRHYRPGNTC